jgi:hypothetical protein
MASIRGRLDKLEQEAEGLYETLRLPDGTEIKYETDEMFGAFLACMDRREHRSLPYLRQMDTNLGMPGLIRALESSRERVEGGG